METIKLNSIQLTALKIARIEKKLTQEALAFHLNIEQTVYSKIERGHKPISENQFHIIQKLLSLDFSDSDL